MNCFCSRAIRTALVSLLFSLAVAAFAQHATEPRPEPIKNVFWQPDQPQQGSPLFVTCELTASAVKVTGTWHGKRLAFFRGEKPSLWYALAGVDLDTQPGPYELKVSAHLRTGRWASATKSVTIESISASAGNVQVPEQYVEPSPEEQEQIDRDDLLKKRAFAVNTPRPLWSGGFAVPIDAPSTPSFAETRLMNEEKTSRHLGTDYPAKEGTEVRASNSGVVALARSMFYEGNIVIIDHGQRFFTVYMHLSRIDVHEGRRVRKGQAIGLSGATGRVSGPHLHFEAKWSGSALDPLQLVHLTLPDLKPAEHRKAH